MTPFHLDDELLVTACVQETGRASLIIAQQAMLSSRPGNSGSNIAETALVCDGTIRIGWVQADGLKPARIPPTLLEALKQ